MASDSWNDPSRIEIGTKEAEEYYVLKIHGDEALKRHKEQYEEQILPADPPLAQPIQGQLTYYFEAELRTTQAMANTMYIMARQKVTMNEPDVVTEDEINFLYSGGRGEICKENLLYLKRFVEKDSDMDRILDKWLNGDFFKYCLRLYPIIRYRKCR